MVQTVQTVQTVYRSSACLHLAGWRRQSTVRRLADLRWQAA